MPKSFKIQKSIRLDKNVVTFIKKIAQKENRTFSNVLENILKAGIDELTQPKS